MACDERSMARDSSILPRISGIVVGSTNMAPIICETEPLNPAIGLMSGM